MWPLKLYMSKDEIDAVTCNGFKTNGILGDYNCYGICFFVSSRPSYGSYTLDNVYFCAVAADGGSRGRHGSPKRNEEQTE